MRYVVIGGGIAGVCCTEELCRLSKPSDRVTLIAAGRVLKVGSGSVMGMNIQIASWASTSPSFVCRASQMLSGSRKISRASKASSFPMADTFRMCRASRANTCMHRAVTERELSSLKHPNLDVLIGSASSVDTQVRTISLENGTCLSYDKLCICTGAVPKVRPASVFLPLLEATWARQVLSKFPPVQRQMLCLVIAA